MVPLLNSVNDFLGSAKGQHDLLSTMLKRLDGLYKELGKYFTFDCNKYALDEFFGDLKTFKDGLQVGGRIKQKKIWVAFCE